MSQLLYFDAFNGVAGDMILGALIDLGLPLDHLLEQLKLLPIEGYELRIATVDRQGLAATDFGVVLTDGTAEMGGTSGGNDDGCDHHDHHSEAGDDNHGRSWRHIRQLIESSRLSPCTRDRALAVFERLAEAEARAHQSDIDQIHFHEVGGVDAIVDIVGACVGFEFLGIEHFYSSPLALGGGTVRFSHGDWPVPTPATAEILQGLPTRMGPIAKELTTPTGAAIVATLASFEDPGVVCFDRSGFGAGDGQFSEIPNVLRLMLGRRDCRRSDAFSEPAHPRRETIYLLEATIDDMDPEVSGYVLEQILEAGALDVYYTPVQMKKSRPGVQLSVLCEPCDQERLAGLIFRETTTLGLRVTRQQRLALERETVEVPTDWGPVQVKVARMNGEIVNIAPEYEVLKTIAASSGQPLKRVRQTVLAEASRMTL